MTLVADLAVFAAVVVVGLAVDRRVDSGARLAALPWWGQSVVGGVALSPLVFEDLRVALGPVDGLAVGFALSVGLWIGLPVALSRLAGLDRPDQRAAC